MKTSILNTIPIDIVEIIIVKSDNYDLFLKLQDFLVKLKEQSRLSRINDKLTKTKIHNNSISFILNGYVYREYNKPSKIYFNYDTIYEYYKNNTLNSYKGLPSTVRISVRYWRENGYNRNEDLPREIRYDGKMEWMTNGYFKRNNNLPRLCSSDGYREFHDKPRKNIIDYL